MMLPFQKKKKGAAYVAPSKQTVGVNFSCVAA